MAQKLLSFLFIFCNIFFSQAAFLHGPSSIMTELRKVESKDFGKRLLDTIALQMSNKAPLQDVAKLLNDLKTNLFEQQTESDNLHNAQEVECETEIANYNARIEHANTEIQEAIANIGTLNVQITQLKGAIANAELQLDILSKREVSLNADYEADVAAHNLRVQDHTQVLEALDIIIPKLESIHGQALGEEVMVQLSKLGKSNPIAALVSIASSLDPAALANVVNKLKEIRTSLANSLESDKQHQVDTENNYKALLHEISTVRDGQKERLANDREALAEAENKLTQETNRRSSNEEELALATNGKDSKTKTCAGWRERYEADKTQRTNEVGVITQVQNILATRLEGMKDYLKERVNQ